MASAFIIFSSCVKEKLETTYNRQEDQIDKYIASNMYVKYTEDGETRTDTLEVVYKGQARSSQTKARSPSTTPDTLSQVQNPPHPRFSPQTIRRRQPPGLLQTRTSRYTL